jgi:fructokinase
MRLGVDLGGTKIEIIAIDETGGEQLRRRISTPRGRYEGIIGAIAGLVREAEQALAAAGHCGPHSLGIGMPGTISPFTGLCVNSNSTEMNGQPFEQDLERALDRPIRFANDANCLAVSEARDGAGAGARVVFAAILGTGCGAGLAIDGAGWDGPHRIAGEWGHNPLPWPSVAEVEQAQTCYCGRRGCLETWISGTGLQQDHARASGQDRRADWIAEAALAGDVDAAAALDRYVDRLARALAHVCNLLDPDVIVLGGGMSNVAGLYARLPAAVMPYLFAERFITPIRPARHGDSSGVRGAAWLWGPG